MLLSQELNAPRNYPGKKQQLKSVITISTPTTTKSQICEIRQRKASHPSKENMDFKDLAQIHRKFSSMFITKYF